MLTVCAPYFILSALLFVVGASCAVLYDSYGVWAWQKWMGKVLPWIAMLVFVADAIGLTH